MSEAYGVSAHADGSCRVCGHLFRPAVFNPGRPDQVDVPGPVQTVLDAFVARYDADGGL